ncbi:MAG: hypothetical protein AAF515_02600 [Pseudomonadota bacterium]
MRILVRILIGVALIGVLYTGVIFAVSELGGEIVVLQRPAADGSVDEIRLWIVDDGDRALIKHGQADAYWMQRLASNPTVRLTREGELRTYGAAVAPESRDRYDELRRAKYGWADATLAVLMGPDAEAVPVALTAQN